MKTPVDTLHIVDKLEAQHPGADTELHYSTAFELLVATILSAQSTDQRVNLVTPALFRRYPTARKLARARAGRRHTNVGKLLPGRHDFSPSRRRDCAPHASLRRASRQRV